MLDVEDNLPEEWTSYFCEWGVLAMNEEEAREKVLEIQARCYSGYAEIVDVSTDDQEYVDTPGIVWQGGRYSIPDEFNLDDEAIDDENENDGFGEDGFDDESPDDDF